LAAIVSAYVVGYSQLLGAEDEGSLNALYAHRREKSAANLFPNIICDDEMVRKRNLQQYILPNFGSPNCQQILILAAIGWSKN